MLPGLLTVYLPLQLLVRLNVNMTLITFGETRNTPPSIPVLIRSVDVITGVRKEKKNHNNKDDDKIKKNERNEKR